MSGVHHEVERVFSPPPDADVPDLTRLPGVASVEALASFDLEAVYVDTPDLALLRSGVTLRRRTGGVDEGWHLKVPSSEGRDEHHRPLGRAVRTAPASLSRLVAGWTHGVALAPVAVIRTRREVHRLAGADGEELAELADDHVTGLPADPDLEPVEWREWELELVDADDTLLAAATKLFAEHDAPQSDVQRKLDRVLDGQLPAPPPTPRKVGPSKPAGRVLANRLLDQVEELLARDHAIRRDDAEGVHGMRKACRRLRTALATYRPLLDRTVTDFVRDELRWVARGLGDARDTQVVFSRVTRLVDEQPAHVVVGPVRTRARRARLDAARSGRREVLEILGSPRYFALLRSLEGLVTDPPWQEVAQQPAKDVLPKRIHRDWKRVKHRHQLAMAVRDEGNQTRYDEALHDVRKAAKRLRYACETVDPVWGDDAAALRDAAEQITETLGDRQDTVVSRRLLTRLAADATVAGESAFTYGRLHAVEESAAARLEEQYAAAWEAINHKSLRRWLR